MTAQALATDRQKDLDARMNDSISKPVDPQMMCEPGQANRLSGPRGTDHGLR